MTQDPIISEINFFPIQPKDGVIGFASLVYRSELYLSGLYVCARLCPSKGKTTYRIAYPRSKVGKDIFHPTNQLTQQLIERAVSGYIDRLIAPDCGPKKEEETDV